MKKKVFNIYTHTEKALLSETQKRDFFQNAKSLRVADAANGEGGSIIDK